MKPSIIKLAVIQRCFPDAVTAAEQAKLLGFDGIALEAAATSSLPVAAVYTNFGFTGVPAADTDTAGRIRNLVELAAKMNCEIVQLPDVAVTARFKQAPSPLAIGDWLLTLADHAADHNVTLAVVNGSAVRTAKMMWNLLERANHPAIACCWDIDRAARWSEISAVSVPTLGSRIAAARIGRVNEATRQFITRLRGIGFGGWLTVDEASIATEASVAQLRSWLMPKAAVVPKVPKKAAAATPSVSR